MQGDVQIVGMIDKKPDLTLKQTPCIPCDSPGKYTKDAFLWLKDAGKLCQRHIDEASQLKDEPEAPKLKITVKEKSFYEREPGSEG